MVNNGESTIGLVVMLMDISESDSMVGGLGDDGLEPGDGWFVFGKKVMNSSKCAAIVCLTMLANGSHQ
jgi:hypothetical protein